MKCKACGYEIDRFGVPQNRGAEKWDATLIYCNVACRWYFKTGKKYPVQKQD